MIDAPEESMYSFGPASLKQALLLQDDLSDIIVYGGSMGSGKTYTSLLKLLKWVDDPHFRGIVIRRNSSTIMKSGFIFDEAKGMYSAFTNNQVKVNHKAQKFIFPSKAEIVFSHLETDKDAESMRGGQFSFCLIDEATEIQLDHALMVLSRLRTKAKMKPQMVLTCNPSPSSFLRDWVDWWLLPEGHEHAGRADPDKCGVRRWFIRIDNEMVWGDTREELIEKFGADVLPLSMTMIGANIFDNPPLIKANPGYLANLQGLKKVRKERDLYGNWNIREETSGFWKSEWCTEIPQAPHPKDIIKSCRAYDIAGNKKSETTPNPDYTASVKMHFLRDGTYVIEEVTRFRGTYGEVHKHIVENGKRDGSRVEIILPQDPGAAGKAAAKMMQLKLSEEGFSSKVRPTNKSKLDRFRPFCSASEAGGIYIVKGCATDFENKIFNNNSFYYAELENFTATRNQKEDMVDATGDAFMFLAQSKKLPNFMHGLSKIDTSVSNPLNSF